MEHLAKLLAPIPLPEALPKSGGLPTAVEGALVHDLGADLPAGHLHVWGGPPGAGKTSFLLSLLYEAALGGRRAVYATYDLPASTLALRLLAMLADVQTDALPEAGRPLDADGPALTREEARRASAVRAGLEPLPFWILESRGFSAASLGDRLVRMPYRPDVVVVDYLQAVIREPGTELGTALRELSDMAARLHLAVLCVFRSDPGRHDEPCDAGTATDVGRREPVDASVAGASLADVADRVGWIAPAEGSGARRAQILANRYGDRPSMPLRIDDATGRLAL